MLFFECVTMSVSELLCPEGRIWWNCLSDVLKVGTLSLEMNVQLGMQSVVQSRVLGSLYSSPGLRMQDE